MYFLLFPFSLVSYVIYKLFRANFYYNIELRKFLNSKDFKKVGNFYKLKNTKNKTKDLLIIGDSMGLSIGAEKSAMHEIFRFNYKNQKSVDVFGKTGSRAVDLYRMSKKLKGKYKTIWVFIGPNDVTSVNLNFNRHLNKAFKELNKHSREVIWSVGDVFIAPMFPKYVKFIPKYFGDYLKKRCLKIAHKHKVTVVEIACASPYDPFFMEPSEYFAKDGFHPNDLGYKYIYDKLHTSSNFL